MSALDPSRVLSVTAQAWRAVLHRDFVGPDDDFFLFGGTSLAAVEVVARLRVALGTDQVTVGQVFRARTPQRLADLLCALARPTFMEQLEPIEATPTTAPAMATVQQQAIHFLEQLDPTRTAYNGLVTVSLSGPIDAARLRTAARRLIARHPILRTRFVLERGMLVQRVESTAPVELEEVDAIGDDDAALAGRIAALGRHRFDVAAPPLIRWTLLRRGADAAVLVQVEHHFVHDGWSVWLLLTELCRFYRGAEAAPFPTPVLDYESYGRWQSGWLKSECAAASAAESVEKLRHAAQCFRFAGDSRRPAVFSHVGATVTATLPAALRDRVMGLARTLAATPFAVVMAAFVVFLGAEGKVDSLTLGSMMRNRRLPGSEPVVGMFVNTVALPFSGWRGKSFAALVDAVMATLAEANDNEALPFPVLVQRLKPPRDLSRNPVFQVCFSMNDWPDRELDFGTGVKAVIAFPSNGGAKFDLDVVLEDPRTFRMLWRYYSPLFEESEVREMIAAFESCLGARLAAPLAALA
jgi:hypothetical protein